MKCSTCRFFDAAPGGVCKRFPQHVPVMDPQWKWCGEYRGVDFEAPAEDPGPQPGPQFTGRRRR